jgi:AAA+ ATPase superfamily predicted ATPase
MNPFVYNEPVKGDDFFNREKIIEDLLDETIREKSHGNIWLTGERQVGKSSLLQYIECECGKKKETINVSGIKDKFNVKYIYTNVQDCDTKEKFYQNLRQSLKNRFDFKLKNPDDPLIAFKDAVKYCFENRHYILFLIDEFDAFVQNLIHTDSLLAVTFLGEFNKLLSGVEGVAGTPKILGTILTANNTYADSIENLPIQGGSGLITIHKDLDFFSLQQVIQMAQTYLKNDVIQFTESEIELCFKLTKGYPYFIQRLFHILYKLKQNKSNPKKIPKDLKEKYKVILKDTIVGWGGDKMVGKTKKKLLELSKSLGQYLGDKAVSALFDILTGKMTGP